MTSPASRQHAANTARRIAANKAAAAAATGVCSPCADGAAAHGGFAPCYCPSN